MKPQWSRASAACELLAVLLVTGTVFMWAKGVALTERGYEAHGWKYLLLTLPVIYYAGKRAILDWSVDLQEPREEGEFFLTKNKF